MLKKHRGERRRENGDEAAVVIGVIPSAFISED
jgi:hypothetical protein